ncbi:MAG: hypothetical protein PHE32_04060 [Candidatus Shapirobacteria bacterium]|nr:hypothetical protein [Candidatus Shapirobacteria bacterium]
MFNFPKIVMPKEVLKVTVNSILRITAGGRHAWCSATIGDFDCEIKKPIGAVKHLLKK